MGKAFEHRIARPGGLKWLASALTLLFSGLLAGCDGIVDVQRGLSAIPADEVTGEGSFRARYVGAAVLFRSAVGDNATYGGLLTDELLWSGSFPRREEIDLRNVHPDNDIVADEPYTSLQRAAKVSRDLRREIEAGAFPNLVPDPSASEELAVTALYSGYARLYLADLFCTLAFDNAAPELGSAEVYGQAIQEFTRAIDAGQAPDEIRNAARMGRARALLQIGDQAGALADAELIPEGFSYHVFYAPGAGANAVRSYTWANRRLPVHFAFRETTIDDTDIPDPRPGVVETGQTSFSGADRAWAPVKYQTTTNSIRVSSWVEAQFIIAEIQGGDVARDIINDLRVQHGVEIVWDADGEATSDEILRKVVEEKGRTLLLEGHRAGDFRRYHDQYGIDLFPTGPRHGDQTCMPLPSKERNNNPGLSGS